MAIPFQTLNFQRSKSDQIWGVDAVRSYPRNVRHHIGLFPRDRNLNCYMCQAEKLIGFQDATPGRNIEIDPTFSMLVAQARENFTEGNFENTEERYDPGITAHWGFTPNIKLNLTINPDFSQIEADAAQLDVNRQFAHYYQERRPFFLEGADFFGFNIPIIRFRSYADPEWGVKLAGKVGSHSIGICVVQDSITNLLLPTSFYTVSTSIERKNLGSVLRYRKDLGITSNFGLIITDREGEDYYNRGAGVDGHFNFTRLDGVNFAVAYSRTKYPEEISTNFGEPDTAFDGWSVQGGYYHNSRTFYWNTNFRVTSPEYRADLGHIYQSNYRNVACALGYTFYNSPEHWYNRFNIGGGYDYEYNFGDTLIYKGGKIWMYINGPKQSHVGLFAFYGKNTYEGLEFDNRMIDLTMNFCPFGDLFLFLNIQYGDQIDYTNIQPGKCLSLSPYAECNIGRHFYIELGHNFEQLNIDEGRLYAANITNLTLKYHFSHRTFIRGILQYVHYNFNTALYPYTIDPIYKHIFSQFLFSYRVNPQTVLYLGYSDNHYGDDIEPIVQTDRTFFAKIGYSFII